MKRSTRSSFGAICALFLVVLAPELLFGQASQMFRTFQYEQTATVPNVPSGSLLRQPVSAVISPLTFNFNMMGNLADMVAGNQGVAQQQLGQNVVNGFVEAADIWRSILADPITVNIDIDFGPIGNGTLGGASPTFDVVRYQDVVATLGLDQSSIGDSIAVANLQTGPEYSFITSDTSFDNSPNPSPRVIDNDLNFSVNTDAANNHFLDVPRANVKALGFTGVPAGPDADIVFTDFSDFMAPLPTSLSWDFDGSNGISPGAIDFVGVALHEIGHALGFISGVDVVDIVASPDFPAPPAFPTAPGPTDLDPFAVHSVLDLFRYTDDSLGQPNQPSGGLNDLAVGQPMPGDRPFFSIDGGATELAAFSTGRFNGDGNQASHWIGGSGLLMAPGVSSGFFVSISPLDVLAFDVIGYDLNQIPEPSSMAGMILLLVGMVAGDRRCSR